MPVQANSGEADVKDGVSLLDVQHHLLMHYCVTLTFYLLLKAEGRAIASHPVVRRLVEIRMALERVLPLRAKLKYQLDKVVRVVPSSDPLRFKPTLDADDDNDDGDERADRKPDDAVAVPSSDVYVPPKTRAVPYDDGADQQKRLSKGARAHVLKRLRESELMQTLRDEFSDAPTRAGTHADDADAVEPDDVREQRLFEEDNFIRIGPVTKKQKKEKKPAPDVDAFDDFEDLDGLLRRSKRDDDELHALRKAKAAARAAIRSQEARNAPSRRRDDDDDDDGGSDDMAMYEAARARSMQKKVERAKKAEAGRKANLVPAEADVADGRRQASAKIVDNKGIRRYRNKEDKNPRVKHRRRFEKAVQKRKGLVKEFAGSAAAGYGGERTGIKASLSRSVSLK